jgi:hypothetical protein
LVAQRLLTVACQEALNLDPTTTAVDIYLPADLAVATAGGPVELMSLEDNDPWYVKDLR